MTPTGSKIDCTIPLENAGCRLDKALSDLLPEYSRSTIQKWLKEDRVKLDAKIAYQREQVVGGEHVEIQVPEIIAGDWQAQEIPLDIKFEDEHLLVINKPAGLVVHPGAGNPDGTLVNALLYFDAELMRLPRAGIVHRLDKDTTGLLVVARTSLAQQILIDQLEKRLIVREYLTLVNGRFIAGGSIDAPVGRHDRDRLKMAVTHKGKPALTHYRIEQRFRAHSLLRVKLESGRTHQIRVHMLHSGHPVVGDPVYGQRLQISKDADESLIAHLRAFKRQALHATDLSFPHPVTEEWISIHQPLPDDMRSLILSLESDFENHNPE